LSEMRTESTTLAAEFALIEAYLKVMQIRLGSRLTYSLSLAPEFADVQIPGMLVLTLVENSIKHGLEPSLRGGSVEVSVNQAAHEFQILVHDTGVGLASSPTWGVGLSNVQERLQLAYGGAGHLKLQDNEPQGTKATITFPAPAKDTTP
jgi:LytS/YehU family sensor histidine kinase